MRTFPFTFPSGTTEYCFDTTIEELREKAPLASTIIITDETVAALHGDKFEGYRMLKIPAGERAKNWQTIEELGKQLIKLGAHRKTLLVGLGGGVVTDITGFLASVFMRGVAFAFVPSTLLGMVDAAVGGKNGVNVDLHKNMLGTINQPKFIFYHTDFLFTLPDEQWSNGFAEIIKYGYIADARIITTLLQSDVMYFQKHPQKLSELIEGCVNIKNKIVNADEQETGMRKMLNFGHTAGHAFEMLNDLPHGHAVGLGMMVAVDLSIQHRNLPEATRGQLKSLLEKYGLPTHIDVDPQQAIDIIRSDKKRDSEGIDYILIDKPGVATIHKMQPEEVMQQLSFA